MGQCVSEERRDPHFPDDNEAVPEQVRRVGSTLTGISRRNSSTRTNGSSASSLEPKLASQPHDGRGGVRKCTQVRRFAFGQRLRSELRLSRMASSGGKGRAGSKVQRPAASAADCPDSDPNLSLSSACQLTHDHDPDYFWVCAEEVTKTQKLRLQAEQRGLRLANLSHPGSEAASAADAPLPEGAAFVTTRCLSPDWSRDVSPVVVAGGSHSCKPGLGASSASFQDLLFSPRCADSGIEGTPGTPRESLCGSMSAEEESVE
eukprot:TRINITY_DN33094_c1_g1_i1.p1 TRINITY_DN33094_c1_g1~~TRINITY_DN33094_c1_g1_i1.p1  ORF type:complete len:261 (+),score=59.79 TRINITY_DN33094_c1_g1_i1:248-1030(+)